MDARGIKPRALLTNGESHIALAVARSLGKNGISVTAGSSLPDGMTFHSRYCKGRFNYPPPKDEDAFIRGLTDEASKGAYDVLFACDSDTFMQVSKHRDRLSPYVDVPMAPHPVMETLNDKAETMKAAKRLGVPCPKTIYELEKATENEVKELGLPLVVKPFIGSGSDGLTYVDSIDHLKEAYDTVVKEHGPAIIQEFIPGDHHLFSGLFNRDGEPRRICVIRKLREYPITGGPTCAGVTVRHDAVTENCIMLFKGLHYYGMGETDVIVDSRDGIPKLLEVNPRFFGAVSISIAAGVDYPHLLYKMATDGDIPADLDYRTGVRGRNLILADTRHMLSVLQGAKSPKYTLSRTRTLVNYLKFHEYKTDYIASLNDPMPAMAELSAIIKRKTSTI